MIPPKQVGDLKNFPEESQCEAVKLACERDFSQLSMVTERSRPATLRNVRGNVSNLPCLKALGRGVCEATLVIYTVSRSRKGSV